MTNNFQDSDVIKSSSLSVSFLLPNNIEVQIAASSKGTGKYRIQSSNFEGLVSITHQIINRLQEIHQNNINFCLDSDIEYEKYYEIITKHHKYFQDIKDLKVKLEEYSNLYTVVQKSILNKYKEKTPPKLNNIDFLLTHIHHSMSEVADELNSLYKKYKLTIKDIIVWTEGMLLLLKIKARLSENQYYTIKDTFPFDNLENLTEMSWIDVTLANMSNFFKFYFNKNNDMQEIRETKELDKWKKFHKSLFEKIIKKEGF